MEIQQPFSEGAEVTSLNGLTGDVILAAGSNISLTPLGNTITIASTASPSPLTTKGDIYGHSTVDARIPVGTDGQALVADSASALGVKYSTLVTGVSSVTSSNGAITVFPTTGAVVATLCTSFSNTWSASQAFAAITVSTINKVTICTPANSATLNLADAANLGVQAGKSVNFCNGVSFNGTDNSSISFGNGGTIAYQTGCNTFCSNNSFSANVTVSGLLTACACGLGTTQQACKGLLLSNIAGAANNAQQISTAIAWKGSGWSTDSSAAQSVDFRSYVLPIQGAATPSAQLLFQSSVNGGSFCTRFYLDTAGNANLNSLTASQFVCSDSSKNLVSFNLFGTANSWTGQQTFGTNSPSAPTSSTQAERFGASAVASADYTAAFGNGATASNSYGIAVGAGALASGLYSTVIGAFASATGQTGISIGQGATTTNGITIGNNSNATNNGLVFGAGSSATGSYSLAFGNGGASAAFDLSIAFGANTVTTASHQFVVGSPYGYINDVYIGGSGVTDTAPVSHTFNATGGSGSDVAGADFNIAAGRATGNANSGSVIFKTSTAGASGTTLRALAERMRVDGATGNVGIGTSSPSQRLEASKTLTDSTGVFSQTTDAASGGTLGGNIKVGVYQISGYSFPGIWLSQASPDASNYAFLGNGTGGDTLFNAPSGKFIDFRIANAFSPSAMRITSSGNVNIAGSVGIGIAASAGSAELLDATAKDGIRIISGSGYYPLSIYASNNTSLLFQVGPLTGDVFSAGTFSTSTGIRATAYGAYMGILSGNRFIFNNGNIQIKSSTDTEVGRFTDTSLTLGIAGTQTGLLKISGTTSGTVTISAADAAGTWTMKVPTTAGSAGQKLQTDGSGVTSWSSAGQVVSSGDLTAQSATVSSVTAITTPNDASAHTYIIGGYVTVTAISAGTVTLTATYTDETGASRTATFFGEGLTTAAISATGQTGFPPVTIRANPNTAVTVVATFAGVSVTFDCGAFITNIN